MKKPSVLRIRPHTAKITCCNQNPFNPYYNMTKDEVSGKLKYMNTIPNPSKYRNSYYGSFNYDQSDITTFTTILQNNNNRGLRSDDHFKRFMKVMQKTRENASIDVENNRQVLKDSEKPFYQQKEVKKIEKTSEQLKIFNQKNFEKKIKNLSEKLNNKTTLVKINEVLKDLYDENKKTKKIIKYLDSYKANKNSHLYGSFLKASKNKTRRSDSALDRSDSNLLDSYASPNSAFLIPPAVTKALNQLKNFIIDVPLIENDMLAEISNKPIISIVTDSKTNQTNQPNNQEIKTIYTKSAMSKSLLPGDQYNNEKHLKADYKMFKGKKGNNLIKKFTEAAKEEAHDIEMNYYLNLSNLKEKDNQAVFNFNEDLHKTYKKETLIRSHGKVFKRKFKKLDKEMKDIDKRHIKGKIDKLEVKIHRSLMKDYKLEEKKVITDLVEKMGKPTKNENDALKTYIS